MACPERPDGQRFDSEGASYLSAGRSGVVRTGGPLPFVLSYGSGAQTFEKAL